jgi:dTDP-4-amino-4,6-dideoxy-D-galactose acyltransferase
MNAMFRAAAAESRRFGFDVVRAEVLAGARLDGLLDALLAARADVAIVRVEEPCEVGHALPGIDAVPALLADGLSTWSCPLAKVAAPARFADDPSLARAARPSDGAAIDDLVARVFADYPNHYRSNPLFEPAGAVAGYAEWARAHVDRDDRTCWVAEHDGRIVALACASHDAAAGKASGNLHGVDPEFTGRGLYTRLITATLRHYAALELREFNIATQAGNLAVQRVWSRLGLAPSRSEHTFHLLPLFGRAFAAAPQALPTDDAPASALFRAHILAFGADAASGLRLHLRDAATSAVVEARSANAPRRDGGAACTTLAFDRHGDVAGWAISTRVP